MKHIILLILLISIFQNSLSAQTNFAKDEEFKYSVRLNFIKAGVSFIKIKDITTIHGHDVYHIVSKTQTTGFLDRMLHIREHMESWTDCDSLFSRKFYKDVKEVNYEKTYSAEFNYNDSIAILNNKKEKPISKPIMDWLSMIYYLRNIDLYIGQEINLTFYDNNKFKDYSALVVERKKIEVDAGIFFCWVIKPGEKAKKNLKHKNELTLYLSVENPRIPVKITSKAKFGTMILELKK